MKEKKFKFFYALSLGWQLGFLVALPLLGFILFGYLLDKKFQTLPFLTLISTSLGVLITIYDVYYLILPFLKKND